MLLRDFITWAPMYTNIHIHIYSIYIKLQALKIMFGLHLFSFKKLKIKIKLYKKSILNNFFGNYFRNICKILITQLGNTVFKICD